jgi:hypothetical protein
MPEATTMTPSAPAYDLADAVDRLYTDGIVGLKGAFSRDWVAALGEDIDRAFDEAIDRPAAPSAAAPTATTSRCTLRTTAVS